MVIKQKTLTEKSNKTENSAIGNLVDQYDPIGIAGDGNIDGGDIRARGSQRISRYSWFSSW
jgi:hypothetical protein